MEGAADLFREDIRHDQWGQIHSHQQGLHFQPHHDGAERLIILYGYHGQFSLLRRENDLFVGIAGAGKGRRDTYGQIEWDRQPPYPRISAHQSAAFL